MRGSRGQTRHLPSELHRFPGFPPGAVGYFEGLALDNSRAYATAHRETYVTAVETPMLTLLDAAAARFGGEVKLFRHQRDVRFSADKRPYRSDAVGGTGSPGGPLSYLRLDVAGLTVGGGWPQPPREDLLRLRRRIDADPAAADPLTAELDGLAAAGFTVLPGRLATVPRGHARDHPQAGLLTRTQLAAELQIAPDVLGDGPATAVRVWTAWKALGGLNAWLAGLGQPAG